MARITCFSILINRNSSTRGNARNLQWCTNRPILILTPSQQSILKPLSWVQSRIFYNFILVHSVIYFAPKSTFYIYTRLNTQAISSQQRLLHVKSIVLWAVTPCSSVEVTDVSEQRTASTFRACLLLVADFLLDLLVDIEDGVPSVFRNVGEPDYNVLQPRR
jgi:hypothetical protein